MGERTNYPGGFEAKTILVFLYSDGRQNFTLGEFEGGRRMLDKADQDSLAQSVDHIEIDVTGKDWNGIIRAANAAADKMRGCSWGDWVRCGRAGPVDLLLADYDLDDAPTYREELTAAGPQFVIPGCERKPIENGKPAQLGLFA